jgi:ubiquinone/menaquinone biosynthesis C-methylase UbiE
MNDKQKLELKFWKNINKTVNLDKMLSESLIYKTKFFKKMEGKGLDVGCGIVSIFEGQDNVIAIDPLMNEYKKITKRKYKTPHICMDGEKLGFKRNSFDWILCVNVIDHTPNPEKMLSEIRRVLKPKGKLYFSVNFDEQLGAEHYSLWDLEKVNKYLKKFKLQVSDTRKNPDFPQSIYQAIYI